MKLSKGTLMETVDRKQQTVWILNETLNILSEETRWTQGESARDASGNPVSYYKDTAACWCLAGAEALASQNAPWPRQPGLRGQRMALIEAVRERGHCNSYVEFNDDPNRKHGEVLAIVKRAIEIAEAQ